LLYLMKTLSCTQIAKQCKKNSQFYLRQIFSVKRLSQVWRR
jgi:hypothetical protein